MDQISNLSDTLKDRLAPLVQFLESKGKLILGIISVLIILVVYFLYFFRRIPRALRNLETYSKNLNIIPISANPEIMKGNFKLCDFYVASSYKSYLPYNQYWDYSSIDAIEKVIRAGARYIELDVFPSGFCLNSEPVVFNGEEAGLYNYTTRLNFEKCIKRISEWAFNSQLSNNTDPFFLCLNIYCDSNKRLLQKISRVIHKNFDNRLLGPKYNWRKSNLALTPIKELQSKMVIISNSNWEGSSMEEYVNFSPDMPFFRSMGHKQIASNLDQNELTDFNRQNLTRVIPQITAERQSVNFNPSISWLNGSQFVCMHYQTIDNMMLLYFENFKKASFVLKPERLRYKPVSYSSPIQQNPVVSFAPIQKTTPLYSITY